jgi:hypothetical protein
MLVPTVNPNPAMLTYAAGPPRTLTIRGARLIAPTPGGETVIGRSAVTSSAYVSAAPGQIVVPIPDALPARNVPVVVSGPLADPVVLGPNPQTLRIDIGGTAKTIDANLPRSLPRATVAGILAGLIHDAMATDPRFSGTRVDLWNNRLVIVSGGLAAAVSITSPAGATIATDLGLAAAQPPGANSAAISGALTSPPPLSSANPRLRVAVGAQPAVTVAIAKPTSLSALASALQAAINGAGGAAEYANAIVATSGSQLLLIPGANGLVTFSAAPGDDSTVVELQLHANFAVRVRVNNAESIDNALLELPQ